jgi:hypothetical protein
LAGLSLTTFTCMYWHWKYKQKRTYVWLPLPHVHWFASSKTQAVEYLVWISLLVRSTLTPSFIVSNTPL